MPITSRSPGNPGNKALPRILPRRAHPGMPQLRAAVVDETASGLAMVDPAVFEAHRH